VAGGTSRLTTAPAATTAPSPTVAAEDGRAGADPDVGADVNRRDRDAGTSISDRCGVTARQEADVRPDHGVFADLDAAHVVEGAPVIDEHVGADLKLEAVVTMDRRHQPKALVDRSARQL